ncbi:hypothetical protein [Nocardia sp. NPDC051570]|uniref:hypothetical protein n=1 Tax=Nocardia sp. NPDC051570 TaxID=3364324 RepID=UPI0037B647EE
MSDLSSDAGGDVCDPIRVYQRCTIDQRRLLNRALFSRLYLADDRITGHEL